MPYWNFVKRQLKFDRPRYLFTKTHKAKTKTQTFYAKKRVIFLNGKKTSSLYETIV